MQPFRLLEYNGRIAGGVAPSAVRPFCIFSPILEEFLTYKIDSVACFRFCSILLLSVPMKTPLILQLAARISLAASLAAVLGACDSDNNEAGPGGVSVGEAEALDEAAEMIEARRLPTQALPQTAGDNVPLPPEKPQDNANDETESEAAE